ncbi:MAG: hypothetical protein AAGB93_01355 [Planctomycetota bacterium]
MVAGRMEDAVRAYERGGIEGLRALVDPAPDETWLDALVAACADARANVAATWLLRAHLEAGADLGRERTASLLRALDRVSDDDARLHLCQTVASLDVPARNAEQLARFLRAGLAGRHKLVRAWSVDGLHRLARQHARYRGEAQIALDGARRDSVASVRARARRIDAERR